MFHSLPSNLSIFFKGKMGMRKVKEGGEGRKNGRRRKRKNNLITSDLNRPSFYHLRDLPNELKLLINLTVIVGSQRRPPFYLGKFQIASTALPPFVFSLLASDAPKVLK